MKKLDQTTRLLAKALFYIAGVALVSMMLITVSDVVLRIFKMPITGAYEIIGFLAAWAMGFAIPQTSVSKGHVAMDFFEGKFPKWVDRILMLITRIIGMLLFALTAYTLYSMGNDLKDSGELTSLLQLPLYPLTYGIAIACAVECLVLGNELIIRITGYKGEH